MGAATRPSLRREREISRVFTAPTDQLGHTLALLSEGVGGSGYKLLPKSPRARYVLHRNADYDLRPRFQWDRFSPSCQRTGAALSRAYHGSDVRERARARTQAFAMPQASTMR